MAAERERFSTENEAPTCPLTVYSLDSTDFNTGRCRLGVSAMKKAGLGVNSAVCLVISNVSIFCRVWPAPYSPPEDFIQVDPSVVLQNEKKHDGESLTGCRLDLLEDVKRVETRSAKVVHATVYVRLEDEDKMAPRLLYDKSRRESQVKCILQDKVFSKHCWVHFKRLLRCGLAFVEEVDKIFINNIEFKTVADEKSQSDCSAATTEADTEFIVKSIRRTTLNSRIQKSFCLAGYGNIANLIHDAVTFPLTFSKSRDMLSLGYPKGFLLLGPPGVGKTSLVRYLAEQCDAELFVINGADIYGPHMGESEANLKNIFATARQASNYVPCIVFIDEIDAICPKRSQGSGTENRVAAQLLTLIDDTTALTDIVLIAATNRPNALDSALRRPGRFDKEFVIGVPTSQQRFEILNSLTKDLPLSEGVELDALAKQCLGYVAADLAALVRQSAMYSLSTAPSNRESVKAINVTTDHFQMAFKAIVPSTYRGMDGIVESSPVRWEDIGGYDDVKQALKQAVEWPILYPDAFSRLGLSRPRGILLYGPPGCCKTTLVRAAATACHCTFLSLSCAQLYSPYVGDAEAIIREVFTKARAVSPTILFLDEVDAVVRKRRTDGSTGAESRILSTLLNEMDGVGISSNVYETGCSTGRLSNENSAKTTLQKNILFVAATNRPEVLDEAILRPGRIDRVVYVPSPDRDTRLEILKLYCRNIPTENEVNLSAIADRTEAFSGADLKNLCREAGLNALQELGIENCCGVYQKHFDQALSAMTPSLSQNQVIAYQNLVIR